MSKATRNIGIILLVLAAVYFYLAPAFRISDGTEVVLWANIIPGIVLAVLGIVLLVIGLRSSSESV